MSKERFDASKLTREDLLDLDVAVCHFITHCKTAKEERKMLLIKRKLEWLLYYVNWDEKKRRGR